jgi:hypothetical protein
VEIRGADTLLPDAFGRFGNEFLGFIRGLFLCHLLGINRVSAKGVKYLFPRPFTTTDGFKVLPEITKDMKVISFNSFKAEGSRECPIEDWALGATVRDEALASLPPVRVNSSALYISARGGDIFEPGTRWFFYGQPPCHYFLDAMRMEGRQTFVMSNREAPNPCIAQMERDGAVFLRNGTWMHDLAHLIQARRVVVSRTTFIPALLLLSKPKDALYAFVSRYRIPQWEGATWQMDRFDRFGPHHKCRATDAYENSVMRRWNASLVQVHIIETTRAGCTWEYGQLGPLSEYDQN